jgi:pimeloyl-ACP methyl ester carboxylesterase
VAHALPRARLDLFDASAHFPYAEQPAQFEHDVSVFLAP